MSVRLDRLEQGLYEMFSGIADDVGWDMSEVPRDKLGASFIELSLLAGPALGLRKHGFGVLVRPASSIIVRVDAAVANTRNTVRLNGFSYYADATGASTVTTIRDSLLTDIIAGEAGAITATAAGTDGVLLTADFLGGIWWLSLTGDLSTDTAVFSGNAVLVTDATVELLVTIQAYSQNKHPRNGAPFLISQVQDAMRDAVKLEALHRYGVAFRDKGDPVSLNAIAGAHWESRSAFDQVVAARSVFVTEVEQIDAASMGLTVNDTIEVTITATTP